MNAALLIRQRSEIFGENNPNMLQYMMLQRFVVRFFSFEKQVFQTS